MTKADILRMAREAGFDEWVGTDDVRFIAVIERFATLISASERNMTEHYVRKRRGAKVTAVK